MKIFTPVVEGTGPFYISAQGAGVKIKDPRPYEHESEAKSCAQLHALEINLELRDLCERYNLTIEAA